MRRSQERYKTFSRRTAIVAGGKFALLSALVGRMYYLQIVESDKYAMLADENRINMRLLAPPRGLIVDRAGRAMAENRQDYKLVVVPEQAGNIGRTLSLLSRIVKLRAEERARIMREVARVHRFVPVTVREGLTWEEVSRIEVNAPDLPGISIAVGLSRHYLYGTEAAHVLGYVSAVAESELDGDPLLRLPDFRIGKNGVERQYDRYLRGRAGTSQVEINAGGRVIKELSRREAKSGLEVALTIDLDIQRFATGRLGQESGSAVVIDVHGGEILAMASTPGYDPNLFESGIGVDLWRELTTNPKAPLINKAISGQYAPGSTFKIVVALAALASGITPDHEVTCYGKIRLGTAKFHCWKRGGHGTLKFLDAIKYSCDVYFYDLALKVGIEKISEMARRMGFGKKLAIDLPGEKPGLIPDKKWKKRVIGEPWQLGETLIAGIGQGYVLATPLQLAVMAARLANGGFAVSPHLIRDRVTRDAIVPRQEQSFPSLGISSSGLALVKEGMDKVTNEVRGTAYSARIKDPEMAMAGKTGTSQVRRISLAERASGVRKNKDLEWARRDHALFVAYAPVHAPRYAIAVVVEHGGSGSRAAAPIARDIMIETQRRDPVRNNPAPRTTKSASLDVKFGN